MSSFVQERTRVLRDSCCLQYLNITVERRVQPVQPSIKSGPTRQSITVSF